MTTLELLNKYPLSTKFIQQWYSKKMLASLKESDIPENIQGLMQQVVTLDNMVAFIDASPHPLFEIFDNKNIFISIEVKDEAFLSSLEWDQSGTFLGTFTTRIVAERTAIERAFEELEKQLENTSREGKI